MTESPFVTTNRLLSEPPSTSDELRIIAADGRKLQASDRAILNRAAAELDWSLRTIRLLQEAVSDNAARLAALAERVREHDRPIEGKIIPHPIHMGASYTVMGYAWPTA